MRGIVCLLLLLLLPLSWAWSYVRKPSLIRYIYRNGGATWEQARDVCRHNHIDLMTIKDFWQVSPYNQGWIGLYRNGTDHQWRWSTDGEAANFTYWDTNTGHPKIGNNCAFKLYNSSYWYSVSCQAKLNFTCYEENLFLVKEKKNWEEAVEHCKLLHMELVTLTSSDDLDYARERADGATTAEVWTGLRHLAGQWLWVDGQRVLNQQLPGCPAQASCGALLVAGSQQPIHASDCMLRKNFLCHRKRFFYRVLIG